MSQEQSEMPQDPSEQVSSPEIVTETAAPVMDCYECSACGYTYEPRKGDARSKTEPGTDFSSLDPTWKCPVCGVPKSRFQNVGRAGAASGFKENLKYGFGVNNMTPGQKNLLIFGSLLLAVLFFLSLYTLE